MFCNSSWQALEANCFCDGEIVCMRCSAPAFNVKVPEKLLSIESRNQFLIYLLAFTLISILVFVFLKLKLLHQLF
jgi:hypothetical protein